MNPSHTVLPLSRDGYSSATIISHFVRAIEALRNQRPFEKGIPYPPLKQKAQNCTRVPILQSLNPFPARSPGCMNEILSLDTARHCFIEYCSFIILWIDAPARPSASVFQSDLEHESGAIHQFPTDGQIPFNFHPFAELSGDFSA